MYGGNTKKEKTIFLHLVWGGRRRYGGVGRKSLAYFCNPQSSSLPHSPPRNVQAMDSKNVEKTTA